MKRVRTKYNPDGIELDKLQDRAQLDNKARVKTCGNIIEVMISDHVNKSPVAVRIDGQHFMDNRTGEIREYKNTDNRAESAESLAVTFRQIRDIVNANTAVPVRCRWLTVTYAENMTDENRLYHDMKNFTARLRRRFGHFEYIQVIEPQRRGAWHAHIILVFDGPAPFMPNDEVASIWGFGFTSTKAMDNNCDNVGAYLSAYLGDIELSEFGSSEDDAINAGYEVREVEIQENDRKVKKKYVKGARLSMYPRGMNIYRASRGIKRPVTEYMSITEAQKKTSAATLAFTKKTSITVENYKNELLYFQYNTKRTKITPKNNKE